MLCAGTTPGSGRVAGLAGRTRIETELGWRCAADLKPGERVYTLDGALRPVKSVLKKTYGAEIKEIFPSGVVLVPGGALNNCEALYLLPGSGILLHGRAVAALCGDSAALVAARDFVGFGGIVRAIPVDGLDVVELAFDADEVIYANSGVLIHCGPHQGQGHAGRTSMFRRLGPQRARVLLHCCFGTDPAEAATPRFPAAA